MLHITKKTKQHLLYFLLVLLFLLFINQLIGPEIFCLSRSYVYNFGIIGLFIYWGFCVNERVYGKNTHAIMMICVVLIICWEWLKVCKYNIVDSELAIRIWYLYYIPQILLPLMILYVSILNGKTEQKPGKWLLLLLPAFSMIILIQTNNMHNLAFNFHGNSPTDYYPNYSYGPVYYIFIAWFILLPILSVVIACHYSRIKGMGKTSRLLILWIFLMLLYLLYYLNGPAPFKRWLIFMPDAYCLFYAGFLESCIQIGLIPTNANHDLVFANSSLIARICNFSGKTVYATNHSAAFDDIPDFSTHSEYENFLFHDSYELHSRKITGGSILWFENVEDVLKLKHQLEELIQDLKEENDLLQAEAKTKEKEASVQAQQKIYQELDDLLAPEFAHLHMLLSEIQPENPKAASLLLDICVPAVYIKRRSNLAFLEWGNSRISIRELDYYIREVFTYLSMMDILCSYDISGQYELSSEKMNLLFGIFHQSLTGDLRNINGYLFTLQFLEDQLYCRMQLELCRIPAPDFAENLCLSDTRVRYHWEIDESTLYLTCTLSAKDVSL